MSLRIRKHSFKPDKSPCFFVVLLQNSSEPLVYYAPENKLLFVLTVLIVVLMLMGSRCLQLGIFVSLKLLPRKTPSSFQWAITKPENSADYRITGIDSRGHLIVSP